MVDVDLKKITDEYDELRQQEAEYKFLLRKVTDRKERLELMMLAVLNQADVKDMSFNGFNFGMKTVTRKALNQQLLKEKYYEQYKDCYEETSKEHFYFKGVE